jgi:ubiquinol-cytochrome c reductase cytochrome b subunit
MIALTVLGKLPPVGINTTLGTIAAYVFIVLWFALPFVTKAEKLVGGKK